MAMRNFLSTINPFQEQPKPTMAPPKKESKASELKLAAPAGETPEAEFAPGDALEPGNLTNKDGPPTGAALAVSVAEAGAASFEGKAGPAGFEPYQSDDESDEETLQWDSSRISLAGELNLKGLPQYTTTTTSRKQLEFFRPQCLLRQVDGEPTAYVVVYHKCRLSSVFLSNGFLHRKLGLLTRSEIAPDKKLVENRDIATSEAAATSRQLQKMGLLGSLSLILVPQGEGEVAPLYGSYKTILPYNSDLNISGVVRTLLGHTFTFIGAEGKQVFYGVEPGSIKSANQRSTAATFL